MEEEFYHRVKNYLKVVTEQELDIAPSIKTLELSKAEINTIKRKKWKYANGKLLTTEGKEVAHRGMVFDILSKCHHRIAHRGRQKTEKWIAEIYSKVNTESCEYFCFSLPFSRRAKTHNHRSETRCKSSSSWNIPFLDWSWSYGFQKLPMWMWTKVQLDYKIILLITTQMFVNVHPIHNKLADEVLNEVQKYCATYGYPQKVLTDNGGEFENEEMKAFCSTNQIQLLHWAARTPTTQGLVERSNPTLKENMRSLIRSTCGLQISKWCKYTMQVSYIMNITYHCASTWHHMKQCFTWRPKGNY